MFHKIVQEKFLKIFHLVQACPQLISQRSSASQAIFTVQQPYKLFKLDFGPETQVSATRDEVLKYYNQMFTIRRMEQKASDLYKEKLARGFLHLVTGQEACNVGIKASMRNFDSIITSYRCHGWTYLQGSPPEKIFAELMGYVTGVSRGKGGSMHLYGENFFGGNGIVGAQVPLGCGSAFTHKYRSTGGVCFTLYGDGAANQGQVYESFNLAKLLNLPVIFVCENNKFGMGTADYRSSASIDYYTRGCYLPGIWVDGMDILAVREASKFAIAHILAGKGPIILEFETYRYFGHSMSDPGTSYRTREDIQKVREARDPIVNFKKKIINASIVTEEELKKLEKEIQKKINEAVDKAKKDKPPPMEELSADIYVKPVDENIRGITPFTKLKHMHSKKSK